MNKKKRDTIDNHIKKIISMSGELRLNAATGVHEIWVKKADLLPLLNKMIKELKEISK